MNGYERVQAFAIRRARKYHNSARIVNSGASNGGFKMTHSEIFRVSASLRHGLFVLIKIQSKGWKFIQMHVTRFDQIVQLVSDSMTSALSFSLLLSEVDEDAATDCTNSLTAFKAWIGILNGI